MPKHMYLLILFTFAVGFLGGGLLYLETNRPSAYEPPAPVEPADEEGFDIIGYRYGGCGRLGCPSYRIGDDGSYTFITRDGEGQDVRYTDAISAKKLEELDSTLRSANFERIMARPYEGICPADYDGIAYRFEIERDGERYSIDSCREDVDAEPLFVLLADYFEIFSVLHRNE